MRDGGEPITPLDLQLDQARAWSADSVARGGCASQDLARFEKTLDWVKQLGLDEAAQIATLLFPGFDGSLGVVESVRKQWGEEITTLLRSLYRVSHLRNQVEDNPEQKSPQGIETLRRMVLALAEDVRVVIIRLAAHLVRLEEVAAQAKEDPENFADVARDLGDETLKIQAPLANRLGIWQLKWALEDLAFRVTEPQAYKTIAGLLEEKRQEREHFITQTIEMLSRALQEAAVPAEVAGRPKHLFSIRNKMRAKHLAFDQLRDIRAFRILVDTEAQCYAVLGILHDRYQPMDAEFDDYITRPKANGYQSLHTVLLDADGRPFEVQIRTHDMHHRAELGIAAHWKYKESGSSTAVKGSDDEKIAWLRQMLDWSRSNSGQVRLSDDRVYALTPKARIIELPGGATPLDFAYHLHTEVGHRCRGAKVDGQMVPLTTPIKTGQTVDLMTVKRGGPSRDWMNPDAGYLKSPRARQKVRAWFHAQDLAAGLVAEKPVDKTGEKSAIALRDELSAEQRAEAAEETILSRIAKPKQSGKGQILVVGVDRMLTALARCCKPAPPDSILGFVTKGRGVSVHRADCATLARMSRDAPERLIQTEWGAAESSDEARYLVDVTLSARTRPDLLRDIAEILAREKIPLVRLDSFPKADRVTMALTLQVLDGHQLARALLLLREITGVESAGRA